MSNGARVSLLAGRGGSDGAVQEGQRAGGRVHGDGHGEVEDCGALAHGRTPRLRGAAGGGEDLRLELQELAHEAEVGRNDAAALLHKLEGLLQLDPVGAHQVRKADGSRPGDACLAVDENAATFVPHGVCRRSKREEIKRLDKCKRSVAAQKQKKIGGTQCLLESTRFIVLCKTSFLKST